MSIGELHRNSSYEGFPVTYTPTPTCEKDYDRQTAAETLKAILSLGYRITEAS